MTLANMRSAFLLLFVVPIFFISCNNHAQSVPNNSQVNNDDSINKTGGSKSFLYIDRGYYEDEKYSCKVQSTYLIPSKIEFDSSYYFVGNQFILTEKSTEKVYKFTLNNPCTSPTSIQIENTAKKLRLNQVLFQVSTPYCNDWTENEFLTIKGNELNKVMEFIDAGPLQFEKLNDQLLSTKVKRRDEVVATFQEYDMTVRSDDFEYNIIRPQRQEISFETVSVEKINGKKISGNKLLPYTIVSGTKVFVDSIFRDTKQVRLIVQDSIIVLCPLSETEGRLMGDPAG